METIRTVTTSQISQNCGIMVTAKFLKELGLYPIYETNNSFLWDEKDLGLIYMRLAEYFIRKATTEAIKLKSEELI